METEKKFNYLHQKKKLIIISIYIMSMAFAVDASLLETEPSIKDFILGFIFAIILTYIVFMIRNFEKKLFLTFQDG